MEEDCHDDYLDEEENATESHDDMRLLLSFPTLMWRITLRRKEMTRGPKRDYKYVVRSYDHI